MPPFASLALASANAPLESTEKAVTQKASFKDAVISSTLECLTLAQNKQDLRLLSKLFVSEVLTSSSVKGAPVYGMYVDGVAVSGTLSKMSKDQTAESLVNAFVQAVDLSVYSLMEAIQTEIDSFQRGGYAASDVGMHYTAPILDAICMVTGKNPKDDAFRQEMELKLCQGNAIALKPDHLFHIFSERLISAFEKEKEAQVQA